MIVETSCRICPEVSALVTRVASNCSRSHCTWSKVRLSCREGSAEFASTSNGVALLQPAMLKFETMIMTNAKVATCMLSAHTRFGASFGAARTVQPCDLTAVWPRHWPYMMQCIELESHEAPLEPLFGMKSRDSQLRLSYADSKRTVHGAEIGIHSLSLVP